MGRVTGNFHILLLFLCLVVVVLPFLRADAVGRLILNVLVGCMLVAAVLALLQRRRAKVVGIVLAAAGLVLAILSNVIPGPHVAMVRHAVSALFLAFTAVVLLGAVLSQGRVDGNKISGSVCVFLLLGFTWSSLYTIAELASPGSVRAPHGDTQALHEALVSGDPDTSMTYFSFVTLTTLGYGDMLPASRVTRMLAWVEAVVGQLYLAILVAWLVGMYLSHSQRK
jgi:hypothetical protein